MSSHSVFIRRLGMKHYIQRHSVCLFTIRIQSCLVTVSQTMEEILFQTSPLGLLASQTHNVPHVLSDPAYNNRSTSSRRCCLTYSTLRRVENKIRSNKRRDIFPAPRQLMMSASGAITRFSRTFNHLWWDYCNRILLYQPRPAVLLPPSLATHYSLSKPAHRAAGR